MISETNAMARVQRICERYHCHDVQLLCEGLYRATQDLCIGSEVVCTDEVLIEEAVYESSDTLNAEISNLSIKIGQFSPFVTTATSPPKYCFAEPRRSAAWFITSVPALSLDVLLEELEIWFPSRYNRNATEYLAEVLNGVSVALRKAWQRRSTPMRAVHLLTKTISSTVPRFVSIKERMGFAAALVEALMPKHSAGLFHNNITAHTVFFSDALSPRFLSNYSGIDASGLRQCIPALILERSRERTFGEQSEDVYSMGLLIYRILTGETVAGPLFELDGRFVPLLPEVLLRRFENKLEIVNDLLAVACGIGESVARLVDKIKSTFIPSRFYHQRLLCRCSGSLLRSVPFLGPILNVWLPTPTARMLKIVLDSAENERCFGPHGIRNRRRRQPGNCTLADIRKALPVSGLERSTHLACAIQEIVNHAIGRPMLAFDNDLVSRSVRRISRIDQWSRRIAVVLFCILMVFTTANHQMRHRHISATEIIAPDVSRALTQKQTAVMEVATEKPQSAALAPAPPRLNANGPLKKGVTIGDTESSVLAAPIESHTQSHACSLGLESDTVYKQVFRVGPDQNGCAFGGLVIYDAKGNGVTIAQTAGDYAKVFVLRVQGENARIIPVRKCNVSKNGREAGRFYEAIGYSGLGDELVAQEGDLIASNAVVLYRIRKERY